MYQQTARRLVLILLAAAATTACGPVEVSPLSAGTSPSTSSGTVVTTSPSPSSDPVSVTSTDQRSSPEVASGAGPNASTNSPCVGPMTFVINGANSADSPKSLCLVAGSVIRIENVYPADVSARPTDRVSCVWEAGIAMCQLVQTGSATVLIAGQSPARSIAVVIV